VATETVTVTVEAETVPVALVVGMIANETETETATATDTMTVTGVMQGMTEMQEMIKEKTGTGTVDAGPELLKPQPCR
jgi:hypothetical protein